MKGIFHYGLARVAGADHGRPIAPSQAPATEVLAGS